MLRIAFLLLACLTMPSGLVAAPAADLPDRFLASLETFQADFEQWRYDRFGHRLEPARGRVAILRPGRFRWEYTEPEPQLLLADGKRLWNYDKLLDQVSVTPQEEALVGSPALLLSDAAPPSKTFIVYRIGTRDDLEWYALEPRNADSQFSLVRLGFDTSDEQPVLREMELTDNFDQRTRIRFEHVRINQPIDPGLFRFRPPPGVDVIGEAGDS